jgi:uncharacterized protein (DUF305 family)
MKRYLTISTLGLAAVVALAGCGTAETGSETPAPEQTATQTSTATESETAQVSAEHNAADTMFAQMMIPHHRQAVQMSEIMLAKDNLDPQITGLATRIKDAQGPEIEKMTGFLQAWGEPVMMPTESSTTAGGTEGHDMGGMESGGMESGAAETTTEGHDMGSMEGMMSEEDLARLEAAQGTEAAELFLTQMIAHHEGAVKMAEEEAANGSNPEAVALAQTIIEDQEAEIQEMQDLLAGL